MITSQRLTSFDVVHAVLMGSAVSDMGKNPEKLVMIGCGPMW